MDTEQPAIHIPRRRLLGVVLAAGTGLLLGVGKSEAMWSVADLLRSLSDDGDQLPRKDLKDVPPSLRGVIGGSAAAYTTYLNRLKLRRISVKAIIDTHAKARGNVHNSIPPRQLWGNIRSTLLVVDKVALRLGEPVDQILSVYRSPAYNARCPGAKSNSYHVRNNAIDFRFRSSPKKVAAVARELRKEGKFKGGVGRYYNFVHIDTRGENADW